MLKVTVVLLASFYIVYASVASKRSELKPNENVGCHIEDLDGVLPVGKSAPSKTGCFEYTCTSIDPTSVSMKSCASAASLTPCRVVEDKSQPYPGCCPRFICYLTLEDSLIL